MMEHTMKTLLALVALTAAAQPSPRTLRLDYVHTGAAAEEHFALDGVALEGAWPGPLDRWIDETNLGKYFFQVTDLATNRAIYSRGFAGIFGEWETTDEAKQVRRAFREKRPLSRPAKPRASRHQEARGAQRIPRRSGRSSSTPPTRPSIAARLPSLPTFGP